MTKNHNTHIMNSSTHHDWATPQELVDTLPFNFDLDVCATLDNAKCSEFISPQMDALHPDRDWPGVCWMNPPFNQVAPFIEKAAAQAINGSLIVALIPARPETYWFHTVWAQASLIVFLGRRVTFSRPHSDCTNAPFPNVLAVFGEPPRPKRKIAEELSKIGVVIVPGAGNIWLHGAKS